MKVSPPPPRTSAIGPLAKMSHVEKSVVCLHCQKVHDRGFIWNFSDTVRVCFTCYREMGEEGRKRYERDAARGESKKAAPQTPDSQPTGSNGTRSATKVVSILTAILGAGPRFLSKALAGKTSEQQV